MTHATGAMPSSQAADSRLYSGYVLAILVVVYTFNFIDRMIEQ